MFIIRSRQLSAFENVAHEMLCKDIAEYLCENHFDTPVFLPAEESEIEKLPSETLNALINTGLRRARAFGLKWESSLSSFVVLMFVVAPNFDEQPAINAGLKNDSIEPDLRLEKMWKTTSEEDWQTAARNYDAEAWQFSEKESN
jgi:hypothetical protein